MHIWVLEGMLWEFEGEMHITIVEGLIWVDLGCKGRFESKGVHLNPKGYEWIEGEKIYLTTKGLIWVDQELKLTFESKQNMMSIDWGANARLNPRRDDLV